MKRPDCDSDEELLVPPPPPPYVEEAAPPSAKMEPAGAWWSWCCGRKRSVVVEPLVVLYLVSSFPLMSITSQFMFFKVAEEMNITVGTASNSSAACLDSIGNVSDAARDRELVQAETANWNMYLMLAHFVPGLLSPLILGSLADHIGRRICFVLPCIGSLLSIAVYMVVIAFDLPIYFLFLTVLENIFGSFYVIFIGTFAYIADTVPPAKRAFRMTLVDVVGILNGAIANLFVGYWIEAQGFFYPLIFCAGGKLLALLYAIFCIPETLVKKSEKNKDPAIKKLFKGILILVKDNGTGRQWQICLLMAIYIISEVMSTMTVKTLYEMNPPLCWDSIFIGYYSSGTIIIMSATVALVSAIPPKYFPTNWKFLAAHVSAVGENTYLAFATTSLMMYFSPVIGCIYFISIPLTRVFISGLVSQEEQGSVFSVMSALANIGSLISSLSVNKIYAATLDFFPGLFFLASAGTQLISLLLSIVYVYKARDQKKLDSPEAGKIGNIQEE